MKTKRELSAQTIVKGLLITSVIYFHATLYGALPDHFSALSQFNILLTLFPFLMMVFFFYAGYNYTSGKRSPWESIKRRSLQLLIILVISSLLSTLLIIAIKIPNGESREAIGNSLLYFLMSEPMALMIGFPSNGVYSFDLNLSLGILWFVYALLILSIIFFLIVDYTIKKPTRLFSIIFILLVFGFCLGQFVGTYLPYTVQCYPVALAMMLLAAYLKKFNFLERKIETKKDLVFTIVNALAAEAIVAGIGLFGYFYYGSTMIGALPGGMFDASIKGYDAFISFIVGFLGTFFIHQTCRLICKIPYVSFALDWYGRHSLYTYLSHGVVLCFIHTIIFKQQKVMGGFQPYGYSFITMGILISIYIIVDVIIYKIKQKKNKTEVPTA